MSKDHFRAMQWNRRLDVPLEAKPLSIVLHSFPYPYQPIGMQPQNHSYLVQSNCGSPWLLLTTNGYLSFYTFLAN